MIFIEGGIPPSIIIIYFIVGSTNIISGGMTNDTELDASPCNK